MPAQELSRLRNLKYCNRETENRCRRSYAATTAAGAVVLWLTANPATADKLDGRGVMSR